MTSDVDSEYPVDEVARAWLTKMRGADADALRPEFEAWRAAAPENREAFARISRRMAASAILKTSARHGAARPRAREWSVSKGWVPWGAFVAAATLIFVAWGAGGVPLPGFGSSGAPSALAAERFATKRGEIRTFALPGGSAATLDTESLIEVSAAAGVRSVRLERGRARLSLTGQRSRLRIIVGDGVIVARDADLDLSLDPDGNIRVALLRGAAAFVVTGPGNHGAENLPLGKTIAYRDRGTAVSAAQLAEAIPRDWPSGWAEYRTVRLDRLVAEANRYSSRPIILDDSSVARLEMSGRFKISETDRFAANIADLFDLDVVRTGDAIRLSSKKLSPAD